MASDPLGKLIQEVAGLRKFVEKQHEKGRNVDAMMQAQAKNLTVKIKSMPQLDADLAVSLQDELETLPWTESQLGQITTAVSNKLSMATGLANNKSIQFATCDTFENYISEKLWEILDDPSIHIMLKADALCQLTIRLHMKYISDSVFQKMTAILSVRGTKNTEPKCRHAACSDLAHQGRARHDAKKTPSFRLRALRSFQPHQ